ncbi:MAG: c-type cytochrome biogenesis protein CcmI [Pseudomonadales bacterium]
MFWIVATLLLAAAVGFTAWPLLRSGRARSVDGLDGRQMAIRSIYQDRVAELDVETAAGQIDDEMREAMVEELGASLLDDYRAAELATAGAVSAPEAPYSPRPWVAAVVMIALPLAGILVYLSVGEPEGVRLAGAAEVLRLNPQTEREQLVIWRDRLERRVERRPADTQSGYLLGISQLQLGEFADAAEAFSRVHAQVGHDPNIMLYLVQSRYLAAEGELDAETRRVAQRLLEMEPNHPLVLEMFAIEAYRRGEYRASVEHLNRALNNPLSAPQFATLLGGLAEARSRMGDLQPSIDVEVTAPEGAPRDGTLFVIARPPGGGMPYAVVRRPAGLLPMSVRLDDTVSMSQDLHLSSAAAFEVVVRLSRSGTPNAHPGDWEWHSEVLQVAELQNPLRLDASLRPPTGGG